MADESNSPRNLIDFHKSVNTEFDVLKNRVRQLIGGKHWLSDGEHKESIIRKILKDRLPASVSTGRGFIYFRDDVSTQLDVLIHKASHPVLFRDGGFVIVTADAPTTIIEVKTELYKKDDVEEAIEKMVKVIGRLRTECPTNKTCKAGIFSIEGGYPSRNPKEVLEVLQAATDGKLGNVIDWLAFGPNTFIRFWENPKDEIINTPSVSSWHLYRLEELARSYFISNVVLENSPDGSPISQTAWFPIKNGKKRFRTYRIPLDPQEGGVEAFPDQGNFS